MNILITTLGLTGLFAGAVGGVVHAVRSGKVSIFMGNSADDRTLTKHALVFGVAGMATGGIAAMALTDDFSMFTNIFHQAEAEKCANSVPAGRTAVFTRDVDGSMKCFIE